MQKECKSLCTFQGRPMAGLALFEQSDVMPVSLELSQNHCPSKLPSWRNVTDSVWLQSILETCLQNLKDKGTEVFFSFWVLFYKKRKQTLLNKKLVKVLWKEQINLGGKIRGVGKGLSYLLWIGQWNVRHPCIGHGIAEAYWHGKLQQWDFRNDISVSESYHDVSDRGSWGLAVLLSNLVCSVWWEVWDNS